MKAQRKNLGGRPPIYKTSRELQARITKYFKTGVTKKRTVLKNGKIKRIPVPTITGLVLYCGFCDRSSFYDLEKDERFSYTIKRARAFITRVYEELLQSNNCTGAIFALKNFGWTDKQELEHSGGLDVTINIIKPRKD